MQSEQNIKMTHLIVIQMKEANNTHILLLRYIFRAKTTILQSVLVLSFSVWEGYIIFYVTEISKYIRHSNNSCVLFFFLSNSVFSDVFPSFSFVKSAIFISAKSTRGKQSLSQNKESHIFSCSLFEKELFSINKEENKTQDTQGNS